MLCIICQENEVTSTDGVEHVIPEAMGGSYTVKTICQKCNAKMNRSIDNPLIIDYTMRHILGFFKVKNKDNEYPEIRFQEKMGDNKIVKLHPDSEGYYTYLTMPSKPEIEDNILKFKEDIRTPKNQIIKTSDTITERLTRDNSEGKNYKIPEESKVQMNENWDKNVFINSEGAIEKNVEIDINCYRKLLVKVAHETTYDFLKEDYLNNSKGENIRLFLKNSDKPFSELINEYDIEIFNENYNPVIFKKIIESIHKHAALNTSNMIKDGEIVENPERVHPSEGNFFHRIQLEYRNNDFYIALHLFLLNNEWIYTGLIKVTNNINIDTANLKVFKRIIEENIDIVTVIDTGKRERTQFIDKH